MIRERERITKRDRSPELPNHSGPSHSNPYFLVWIFKSLTFPQEREKGKMRGRKRKSREGEYQEFLGGSSGEGERLAKEVSFGCSSQSVHS